MIWRASGLRASLESRDALPGAKAPMPETQRLKSARRFSAHSSIISTSTAKQSVKLRRHTVVTLKIPPTSMNVTELR